MVDHIRSQEAHALPHSHTNTEYFMRAEVMPHNEITKQMSNSTSARSAPRFSTFFSGQLFGIPAASTSPAIFQSDGDTAHDDQKVGYQVDKDSDAAVITHKDSVVRNHPSIAEYGMSKTFLRSPRLPAMVIAMNPNARRTSNIRGIEQPRFASGPDDEERL
jgi:hypothetical protein